MLAGRFARSIVPALASIDVRALALTAVFISLLSALASIGPWRRAQGIDPAAILRKP